MDNLFKVIQLQIEDKKGNLKAEAHSSVKSTKYFPLFELDGKKMIFKPLSKTKPLTTPLFSYSEVYWSYVINKYFDSSAPRYYLAISKGIDKEQPKYFEQGVLVESITPNGEKLINLYDYFSEHPDDNVDIKDYVNYCMKSYDYTKILLSEFIKNNEEIGKGLSYQILLSVLRQDRNFHYENVNFIFDGEKETLTPPIDFEFSLPFLYPDKHDNYNSEKEKYLDSINIKYEEEQITILLKKIGIKLSNTVKSNLCLIVKLYPDVVMKFVEDLGGFINECPTIRLSDPDNYIGALNSDYWEVGHAFYKDNDLVKYKKLKEAIKLEYIDKDEIFNRITHDVLQFSKDLSSILKKYMVAYAKGIDNLEDLTIKQILEYLSIDDEKDIETQYQGLVIEFNKQSAKFTKACLKA